MSWKFCYNWTVGYEQVRSVELWETANKNKLQIGSMDFVLLFKSRKYLGHHYVIKISRNKTQQQKLLYYFCVVNTVLKTYFLILIHQIRKSECWYFLVTFEDLSLTTRTCLYHFITTRTIFGDEYLNLISQLSIISNYYRM